MSTSQRRCESHDIHHAITVERNCQLTNYPKNRFVDCENWRKETKLDETVPVWDYPEKEALFKYYPQYYHKTDKVHTTPMHCRHCFTNVAAIVQAFLRN